MIAVLRDHIYCLPVCATLQTVSLDCWHLVQLSGGQVVREPIWSGQVLRTRDSAWGMKRVNKWLVLRCTMRRYMHVQRCARERGTWVYSSSVWHGNLNCVYMYVPKHPLFLTEQLVLLFSHSNVSSIDITFQEGLLMLALTRYSALLNIISHQLQHRSPLSIPTREGKRRRVLQRAMENASKASSSHSVTKVISLQ